MAASESSGAATSRSTSEVSWSSSNVACAARMAAEARPSDLEAVEHRGGVLGATLGVLVEQSQDELVDVPRDPPAGALALGGSGVCVTWAKAASVADSKAKTGLPESSSYIIAPKE